MKMTQLLMAARLSSNTSTTNQVSEFSKLIAEYGSEVVILAIFLLIVTLLISFMVKSNNKNQKYMQDMYEKKAEMIMETQKESTRMVQENFERMLTVLIENIQKPHAEATKPASDEKPTHNKGHEVDDELTYQKIFKIECRKVLNDLKCDRIAVYVFHNGNKSTFGYHFIKMSCIHEETINGTHTGRGVTTHHGIPLGAFSSVIDCLIKNDEYIVGNVYDHGIISADEKILNFISGSIVKSLFLRAVKDPNGEIIAFVDAEWNTEQDFSAASFYNKVRGSLNGLGQSIYPIITGEDIKTIVDDD